MTKRGVLRLVALCYGVVLAGGLCFALYNFAADSLARANGTLQTRALTFDDFETYLVKVESPTQAVSAGEDAQLILQLQDTRAVSVAFEIAFSKQPGEVVLYYAAAGEDFSNAKKIWAKQRNDGSYTFTLPRTRIDTLRVDPTNQNGISMQLRHFTLNPQRGFFSYFAFTYENAFHFLLWPGLAAAALGCVGEQINLAALWRTVRDKLRRGRA